MKDVLQDQIAMIGSLFGEYIQDLTDFIRIPSVTQDLEASRKAALWLMGRLEGLGLENIQMFETIGNPILFATKTSPRKDAPTVLVYGHYDVQLPDPVGEWESPPFAAEQRDEYLYGRGSSDMKGQILAVLYAIGIMLSEKTLPVNLKFLIEGNEEAPPGALKAFLPDHLDLLQADISLNCDAGMLGSDIPTISYGLRGGVSARIRISGPSMDLHDGAFGGVIQNPIHVLNRLIVDLHDEENRITLPHFYDKVRSIPSEERVFLAASPMDELYYQKNAGVTALWGEAGFHPIERTGARPSLNVRMFEAGADKTAIPRVAEARVGIRLVPNQDPDEVFSMLEKYVHEKIPETVQAEIEYVSGYPPYLLDLGLPAIQSLRRALEQTWEAETIFHLVGGGIPVVQRLKDHLGIESLLTGFSLPDDHIHGPNERLHLPTVKKGIAALLRFFHYFGKDAG
jgi:acetylornithine deacetylase/succinyl-diaminopimelate desuccinylase-like protein